MATVGHHQASIRFFHCFRFPSPKLLHLRNSNSHKPAKVLFSTDISQKFRVSKSIYIRRNENLSFYCFCKSDAEVELENVQEDNERPPFDINLAVILAGFAFEAYWSPPENVGRREVDAANCQTVFLSESFLREVYDGQLFIKLKKGVDFPAMDPWGTSDPYVVMQLDGQVVKSKVKWATKDPIWNEELTLNIRKSPAKNLQVAAWDANLVTPHKRMGYTSISVESFCDGNLHEVMVELEGMGGGGKIHLEVKYKSFDGIDEEKQWWRIPFISDFPWKKTFESALKQVVGSETVQARQFVQYAFGHLKIFSDGYIEKSRPQIERSGKSENSVSVLNMSSQHEIDSDGYLDEKRCREDSDLWEDHDDKGGVDVENTSSGKRNVNGAVQSDKYFWMNFSNVINQNVVQKLGLPAPDKIKWDRFDLLSKIGLQSRQIAEAGYIESGLATAEGQVVNNATGDAPIDSTVQYALPDMKKTSWDMLRETDSILGALMVLAATFSQQKNEAHSLQENETEKDANTTLKDGISGYYTNERIDSYLGGSTLDERKAGEMKALFSTAESAMEAWALLATSLGHPSFIKSEFEKLCFLDNPSTDTQVAIWRDSARKRLVVAFRGTEQTRWKDLRTDLMLVPAGLNPERLGSDFKQEVQVHSGFLSAYDSVRTRIMSLIKLSIGFIDDVEEAAPKWHIYVTGHSLGGALATLLALELSSSQLAKCGTISVTMYNFGSPRVGNRRFAEIYNEKVKDSWRIVNHRDIIPTVPRLMGYCHVAQPVYLATGDLRNALENIELSGDGYQGDIIGESTPDVIVGEFMKGEKELIEKILNTEINIFRSIRDGSALMQHMEDFYYITLLENVRLNYDMADRSNSNGGTLSV